MKSWNLLILLLASVSISLTGCSTTAEVQTTRNGREALFPFPQQPAESIRLIIYRPQVLVGMWGKPVIIVNGERMGNPGSPATENHLQPGSVFVVDAPASLTRVWWSQPSQGEAGDKAISYVGLTGAKRYLRWTMKPTYGYLQEVDETSAAAEIAPLRFSAYVNLIARN
jgi:hypothetical protein